MTNAKQIVYLSQAQYQELVTNRTITVNGVTLTYSDNDIYVTPQVAPVTDIQLEGISLVNNGIVNMPSTLAIDELVTGTDISITALPGRRYICPNEIISISITAPSYGAFEVCFQTGSSVVAMTSTGITWPEWFNPSTLEVHSDYEINVVDGKGVVMSWPA